MKRLFDHGASGGGAFLADRGQDVKRARILKILRYCGTKVAGSIIKILCKPQELDGTAMFHPSSSTKCHFLLHRGVEKSNYNLIKDEHRPSPQPSPIGEGVSNKLNNEIQSGVQDDAHSPKLTYSFINLFSYLSRKRVAFTLAEVLITLGIIGVVAAMTMPSLIEKHQEKAFIVSARKAFSTIVNATKLAQSQNEMIGDNTFLFDPSKTSAEVAQEYAKYFNGAKVCLSKTSAGCSQYFYDKIKYTTSGCSDAINVIYPLILLSDGSVLAIHQLTSCTQSTFICDATDPDTGNCTKDDEGNSLGHISDLHYCANIIVDVNGPKAPNQFGRDVYSGRVWQNGKITFTDWGQTGGTSARNIHQGIDKLEYKKF